MGDQTADEAGGRGWEMGRVPALLISSAWLPTKKRNFIVDDGATTILG